MSTHGPLAEAVTFVNADIGGDIGSLRVEGARIAALREAPRGGDLLVDLQGDRLLPGLINAHDHLQLNSLMPLELDKLYRNVRGWISDVVALRHSNPEFEASVAIRRDERLLIGGVKNLLSGVTTVAHHDRFYPFLSDANYPTQVIERYGWSHSLYIDGETRVSRSMRLTPFAWPWIIHASEGLDGEAAEEFERLDAIGCLAPNTLIVHGIALDRAQRMRLQGAGAGLIWCPSSNLGLFGKTADVADLIGSGRVALGTDSRLSGSRDLLEEVRIACDCCGVGDLTLESIVTCRSAQLLRLPDRGVLKVGARADLLILPAGMRLARATRADIRLVLLGGVPRYGDTHYMKMIAPASTWVQVRVDGRSKSLNSRITALLAASAAREPGLELAGAIGRAA